MLAKRWQETRIPTPPKSSSRLTCVSSPVLRWAIAATVADRRGHSRRQVVLDAGRKTFDPVKGFRLANIRDVVDSCLFKSYILTRRGASLKWAPRPRRRSCSSIGGARRASCRRSTTAICSRSTLRRSRQSSASRRMSSIRIAARRPTHPQRADPRRVPEFGRVAGLARRRHAHPGRPLVEDEESAAKASPTCRRRCRS